MISSGWVLEESISRDGQAVSPKVHYSSLEFQTLCSHILVIPGRDIYTLEKLGRYYILCSNHAAARAYLDRTLALSNLKRAHNKTLSARLPPPPGVLRDKEDPDEVLRGFTLVPENGRLSLQLLEQPYRSSMRDFLTSGGPVPLVAKEGKPGEMVLFSFDRGYISHFDLVQALKKDGKRRNLHWRIGGEQEHIIQIHDNQQDDDSEEKDAGVEGFTNMDPGRPRKPIQRPSRYIIYFKDRHEARRFVREWHRRPFSVKREYSPGDEPPPIVNAELLW